MFEGPQKPKISRDELEKGIQSSDCWTGLLSYFGKSYTGGNLKTLKGYIAHYGLSTDHFVKFKSPLNTKANFLKRKYTNDELFSLNDIHPSIVKHHYRKLYPPSSCAKCGIGPGWDRLPLTLQIDHISGNNKDHRLENLRYLCPNCHTQTDTYGMKDRRKWKDGRKIKLVGDKSHTRKVDHDEVARAYEADPCYSRVGKKFGITDNGVKRIIKKRGGAQ